MTTIVDASFAINWILDDQGRLDVIIEQASVGGLSSPIIFWYEVASALRNLHRKSTLTLAARNTALVKLELLGVAIDDEQPAISRVLAVADQYSLSVYDAAYLELTIRSGGDLATHDAGLASAALRANVIVLGNA